MADTGWVIAGSGVNQAGAGVDWTSPGNVTADDGSSASSILVAQLPDVLFAGTFGFGPLIPSNQQITAVDIRIEATVASSILEVRLTKSASIEGILDLLADGLVTYDNLGSWGISLTPAEVASADFGVTVSATATTTGTVTIDAIWVKVYYFPIVFINASTGSTDATGGWSATCHAPGAAGRLIILQVLQDGATDGAVTQTSATNIEDLAGTDNAMAYIGAFDVGSPQAAIQHLWIGRSLSTSAPTFTGGNSTSEDVYWRFYEFNGVSPGATLAEVIENVTAGTATNGTAAASATASDTAVTTLSDGRLALNFIGVNDDNVIAVFTGETGGDWVFPITPGATTITPFASSTGTDGAIGLQVSEMATAGTIDGGTASITDIDSWGVVGFALRPAQRIPYRSAMRQLIAQ